MISLSPAQLTAALDWRYATKKFDPTRKIPADVWAALEHALVVAPSSFGLQPWKFIVVTDSAVRSKLLPVSWGQAQVVEAPGGAGGWLADTLARMQGQLASTASQLAALQSENAALRGEAASAAERLRLVDSTASQAARLEADNFAMLERIRLLEAGSRG